MRREASAERSAGSEPPMSRHVKTAGPEVRVQPTARMMAAVQLLLLLTVGCVETSTRRPPDVPPCQVVQAQVFCSALGLSRAPLNLPDGVQTLDLSRNRVQTLSRETLSFQTGLRQLDLHSNRILSVQPGLFGDMSQLRVLDLSRNQLSVLGLSGQSVGPLPSVRSLDLSHNGLYTGMSDSFLSHSPSLWNLSMDGNSITRISQSTFAGALSLRRISLRNNVILEIEDGAFDSLDHLSDLDLSRNSISCIADFNLYHLERLNLSQNSVELFHSAASGFYRLLSLDLSHNRLLYFPLLPENNMLQRLDVSHNRLQSVNASGRPDRDANLVFNQLRLLDMSFNRLQSVPECFFYCMGQLQVLRLRGNCLSSFSVGQPDVLRRLRLLDLSANALRGLRFGQSSLQALETLLLQGNELRTLDQAVFQRLSSLKYLHLERNSLEVCPSRRARRRRRAAARCVSLSAVRRLRSLYLSDNELRTLPANAFADTPLELLDLSLNPGLDLREDSLWGLERSLVHLLLRDNNMSSLNADLSSLRRLRHVDLSANRLTSLPAWSGASSIESLNLQNNNLVTLESGAVAALQPSLRTLYMGSNPLRCCSNLGLVRMLQHAAVVVPDMEAVTCVLRGRAQPLRLSQLTPDMCRPPDAPRYVAAAVVTLLAAALALGLLLKCFCARKQKRSRSFSA